MRKERGRYNAEGFSAILKEYGTNPSFSIAVRYGLGSTGSGSGSGSRGISK
jgi:hypothetical protein